MSRMPFWQFSRSTLIISVNSIYWLVFVVKTEFSVRHELTFYIYNLVEQKPVPLPVCGGQTGSGTGLCSSTSVFSHQHHSTHLYTHFHPNTTHQKYRRAQPENAQSKHYSFEYLEQMEKKVLPLFLIIHWRANGWSLEIFQQRWCSGVNRRATRKKITFSLQRVVMFVSFNVHGSLHRKNILKYVNKMPTLHGLLISKNSSTCFGWHLHPTSGAHTTVSTASGIWHTDTAVVAGSSNGVTNTVRCRYSCLRSWWWVEVPPETCRAVSRYK
jgi:hypothetical protein